MQKPNSLKTFEMKRGKKDQDFYIIYQACICLITNEEICYIKEVGKIIPRAADLGNPEKKIKLIKRLKIKRKE